MPTKVSRARSQIGVWVELPRGARWANEGMARLIGFMIEGAAQVDGPCFHITVPRGVDQAIREDMSSLKAREGIDWHVHAPVSDLERKTKSNQNSNRPVSFVAKLRAMPPEKASRILYRRARAILPFMAIRSWITGRKFSIKDRLATLNAMRRDAVPHLMGISRIYAQLPGRAAKRTALDFAEWAADVGLNSISNSDHDSLLRMAEYANRHIQVDGWIVLHPFFRGAELLEKPRAVIFPDAIPLTFPTTDPAHWTADGPGTMWRKNAREALGKAPTIITFSNHVARKQLEGVVGIQQGRVRVIPHAPPSVAEHLPFLRHQPVHDSTETRRQAAELLRLAAKEKQLGYLTDFPFEHVPYFVVSTQDRATKNIGLAAEALEVLVRHMGVDVKMITTAEIHWGQSWTKLPSLIETRQLHRDVISMHDLSRQAHAALYHCASVTVHPAFFEGGHGPFPFYESLSVGCPCLMARGPHTEELVEQEPGLKDYLFDPYDPERLAARIADTIRRRASIVSHQLSILARLRQRTWADVAVAYADAAMSGVEEKA